MNLWVFQVEYWVLFIVQSRPNANHFIYVVNRIELDQISEVMNEVFKVSESRIGTFEILKILNFITIDFSFAHIWNQQ